MPLRVESGRVDALGDDDLPLGRGAGEGGQEQQDEQGERGTVRCHGSLLGAASAARDAARGGPRSTTQIDTTLRLPTSTDSQPEPTPYPKHGSRGGRPAPRLARRGAAPAYVVYAENRTVCARALWSVITLTMAGLPDANARSSAGRMSCGFSTNSPCAPRSMAMRS